MTSWECKYSYKVWCLYQKLHASRTIPNAVEVIPVRTHQEKRRDGNFRRAFLPTRLTAPGSTLGLRGWFIPRFRRPRIVR